MPKHLKISAASELVGVRCGVFRMSAELILMAIRAHGAEAGDAEMELSALRALFGEFIILDVEKTDEAIEYFALSDLFDPIETSGAIVPSYDVGFIIDNDDLNQNKCCYSLYVKQSGSDRVRTKRLSIST